MAEIILNLKSNWVHSKNRFAITDNFEKIIQFYLWGTPCNWTSSRWRGITEHGWPKEIWRKSSLKKYLMHAADLKDGYNYKKVKVLNDMSTVAAEISIGRNFPHYKMSNRVLIYNSSDNSDIMQIFYYIRCALAHGRFEKRIHDGTIIYAMEAVQKKGSEYSLRARMLLKEETLIEWMNTIIGGLSEFDSRLETLNSAYKDMIIKNLRGTSDKVTRKTLITSLPISKLDANRLVDALRDDKIIAYDNSKRTWQLIDSNN